MRIARANKVAIEYACKNFHYAKCVPCNPLGYNIYNSKDEWCGVILFGYGASPMIGSPYGLGQGQTLELTRVALNGKQECTSQAVALALKELKKDCPLVRLAVSYADIDQDHLGTIYQATNWIYIGETTAGESHAFIIDGKKIHENTVRKNVLSKGLPSSIENIKKVYKTSHVEKFFTKGKRKYLMPLNKKIRKQILPLAKPYPKEDENWQKVDRTQFINQQQHETI